MVTYEWTAGPGLGVDVDDAAAGLGAGFGLRDLETGNVRSTSKRNGSAQPGGGVGRRHKPAWVMNFGFMYDSIASLPPSEP